MESQKIEMVQRKALTGPYMTFPPSPYSSVTQMQQELG